MASPVRWDIGLYDRLANPQDSTSFDGTVTNEFLKHAFNLTWTMPLNGIDMFEFSLYLDDPAAALIAHKTSLIRVWRYIDDDENSKYLTPAAGTPDFCGVVSRVFKHGAENRMDCVAMSPLWLLQSRFHILNHRLVIDTSEYGDPTDYEGGNANDEPWDHSALMFRIIDMINGAFNDSGGDTGIRKPPAPLFEGNTLYWPRTIEVSPFFVAKGTIPWSHIFDNLMNRPDAPDIAPEYIYDEGERDTMYFRTAIHRGTDRFSTVNFGYRTGTKNLSDFTEDSQVVPGEYANYVWAVGDGGPNGPAVGQDQNSSEMLSKGLYMKMEEVKGAKLRDVDDLAESFLDVAQLADDPIYEIKLAELTPTYFGLDFFLGDMVKLNASKGALSVVNKKQRIYQVVLNWSNNNTETVSLQIASDFKGKYP